VPSRVNPYENPAILDVIKTIFSTEKSPTRSITANNFIEQFNPMPDEVVAFVLTAVKSNFLPMLSHSSYLYSLDSGSA